MNDQRRSLMGNSSDNWPTENGMYYYYTDGSWSSNYTNTKTVDGYLYVEGNIRFVRKQYPEVMVFGVSNQRSVSNSSLYITDSSVCGGKRNTLQFISDAGYTTDYDYYNRQYAVACSYCRNTFFNGGSSDEDRGYMPSAKEADIICRFYRQYGLGPLYNIGSENNGYYTYNTYGLATNTPLFQNDYFGEWFTGIRGMCITSQYNSRTRVYGWYDNGDIFDIGTTYMNRSSSDYIYNGCIESEYYSPIPVYPIWCPGGDHVEADGTTF